MSVLKTKEGDVVIDGSVSATSVSATTFSGDGSGLSGVITPTGDGSGLSGLVKPTSYATSTVGGTVKVRLSGSTLYITTNGNNA